MIIEEGEEIWLENLEYLEIGDMMKVNAGELIPTDGIVSSGSGFVNESTLTGES